MNVGLHRNFKEYLKERIESHTQTILSGNLSLENYVAECAKVTTIKMIQEEFDELWERASKEMY